MEYPTVISFLREHEVPDVLFYWDDGDTYAFLWPDLASDKMTNNQRVLDGEFDEIFVRKGDWGGETA